MSMTVASRFFHSLEVAIDKKMCSWKNFKLQQNTCRATHLLNQRGMSHLSISNIPGHAVYKFLQGAVTNFAQNIYVQVCVFEIARMLSFTGAFKTHFFIFKNI